jgi:hypothetical protein
LDYIGWIGNKAVDGKTTDRYLPFVYMKDDDLDENDSEYLKAVAKPIKQGRPIVGKPLK